MKYIILVGDGMGDEPLAELQGRTPLEAARTPAMDYLAGRGELLLLQTIPDGYPPGSDVANLSLLGYLPEECYTGRAPLEAASMGIELATGEIAFRCNLVTLDHDDSGKIIMVDYSAGHISTAEAAELIRALDKALGNEQFRFYPGVSYRHLFVHQGKINGLETVPPHDYTGRDVHEFWGRYLKIPHLRSLMQKAEDILAAHPVNRARIKQGKNPANAIWLWGEGKSPKMPTLAVQFGINGTLISAVDLLKGIGVYAGLEIIAVPGATGYLDTNYAGKVSAALESLATHDFVFVHVEAPDEVSHEGDLDKKLQAIEAFDEKIVQPILDGVKGRYDFRLAITMDHFTPVKLKTHTDQPVPILIYDSGRDIDHGGPLYSERNAIAHGKPMPNGREFIQYLLGK